MSNLFITDNLPTLGQIHPDQAKNMMELCKEMEGLIDQTNTHVSQMIKQQQNNILTAFKTVLENMKADIDKINEKFHKYVAYHESDSQVVNAQNKMVFFRQECHNLNEQCKSLKFNITKLTQSNEYLENELQFTKKALFNQVQKNQKLQDTIKQYKIQILQMCCFNSDTNSRIQLNKIIDLQKKNDEQYQKLNLGPLTTNIRRTRGFSESKKNTHHQRSYNSVEGTDFQSKQIYSQQTRAGSLQKSLCPKQSAILDYNLLENSLPQKQFYEYSLLQSQNKSGD